MISTRKKNQGYARELHTFCITLPQIKVKTYEYGIESDKQTCMDR